ncbi:MAG: hypothetical protein QM667_14215 [Asticcacaulis sp.]
MIALVYFISLIIILFQPPVVMAAIDARTDIVEFTSSTDELNAFWARNAQVTREDGSHFCLSGTFQPTKNSRITMARSTNATLGERLYYRIEPSDGGASLTVVEADGNEQRYKGIMALTFSPADTACPSDTRLRLPLMGPVRLGQPYVSRRYEDDSGALTLLSGRITLYAKAIDTFAFFRFSKTDNGFYQAGTVDLPAGAELTAARDADANARWAGFADIDITNTSEPGFDVRLTTDARRLALTTAAGGFGSENTGGSPADNQDVVSLSNVTRLVSDPNIGRVNVAAAIFLVLVQVTGQLISLYPRKPQ